MVSLHVSLKIVLICYFYWVCLSSKGKRLLAFLELIMRLLICFEER